MTIQFFLDALFFFQIIQTILLLAIFSQWKWTKEDEIEDKIYEVDLKNFRSEVLKEIKSLRKSLFYLSKK